MFKYQKIGLGGTFDHFHKGHQAFLLFASQLSKHLVIGITTPEMITHKKFNAQIQSYEERADAVKSFTKNFFNTVDVIPLTDPYGPTLVGSNVEALAATTATKAGAEAVNKKRKSLGLMELPIHTCELENDDNGQPLASEKIRAGKINRLGNVYKNIFSQTLHLTKEQKSFFSQQQGEVVSTPSPAENIFVVGDSCLETFIKNKWQYQLGVVDFLKQKKTYQPPVISVDISTVHINNPAGTITTELANALENALDTRLQHLIVEGEEDLAAVALVLLAPLGSHIYYGQPNVGMIEMIATEEKKEACLKVLTNS